MSDQQQRQSADSDDPYSERSYAEYFSSDEETNSASSASTSSSSRTSASSGNERQRSTASGSRQSNREKRFEFTHNPGGNDGSSDPTQREAGEEPLLGMGSSSQGRRADGFRNNPQAGQNDDEADEDDDTDAYYALLNVQKDASEDEIKDAYRSLAVALHPDKHPTPDLKVAAENRFRAVQKAYEVLSDAEKRSIYDHFGPKGLTRSWSLVRRSNAGGPRTAAEMREEWERMARQQKAEEMENRVRSKSEFTANLDATSLFCSAERVPRSKEVIQRIGEEIKQMEKEKGKSFDPGEHIEVQLPDVSFSERWARVGFTSLVGKHGWETPLTMYSRFLINGQMASKGGMGGGNVTGTLKTQWNPKLGTEASVTLLPPRVASLKGQYELTKFSFLSFVATGSTFKIPPALQLSFAQRLSEKTNMTGFTVFNTGTYTLGFWGKDVRLRSPQTPSITFGVSDRLGDGKGWTCQAGLGMEDQSLSLDYAYRPAILGSPKLRLGLTLGTRSGMTAFHSMERKITDHVRIGMGLHFGIPMGGVSLQLRFNRLGQKLVVPIQLSPEYRPELVAGCALIPGAGLLAAEHLYFRPRRRRNVQNRLVNLRTQHKDMIVQRKQAAAEAIHVLRGGARKRAHAEFSSGGLVIVQAYYGKRNSWPIFEENISPEELFRSVWGTAATNGHADPNEQAFAENTSSTPEDVNVDWWDVTIPVMMLVHKGQLIIPGDRQKHKLLGFFDPCMGERKHLIVRYLFRDRLHEVVVDDITQLTAPLRVHQL
ncbi:uncharacterized protein FA14DRAFT_151104 [Meira miltonrushii]|uniref:J domain-containing protein n=1 Tax=Meira miltonrushii TaxID=1280837 RepID=A0A316V8A3_9BASI|nr:uncharacterized protein FA14DRAFT_151104 [Meira miltonrushii]PWN31705.1 hypothetical protein FA14DRAFT_151104 [Meira miltonrushii]